MIRCAVGILVVLGVAANPVVAQQPGEAVVQPHPHELYDLSEASRQQCELATASVGDVERLIEEVRLMADLARARAALRDVDGLLREVRQHLGSCTDILRLVGRESPTPKTALRFTRTTHSVLALLCDREIPASAAPTTMHDGNTYYFCSASDRDEFAKEPTRYLAKGHR